MAKRFEDRYVYGTVGCDYYEMEPDLYQVEDAFTEDLDAAWKAFLTTAKYADSDEVFYFVCVKQTVEIEEGYEDEVVSEELDEILDDCGVDHSEPPEWDD